IGHRLLRDLAALVHSVPLVCLELLHERRRPYELSSPTPSRNSAELPRSRLADNSFRGVSLRIDCGLGRAREVGEKADSMERARTVLQEERTAHSLVASTWRSRNSAFGKRPGT